jgi:hypothetical protein
MSTLLTHWWPSLLRTSRRGAIGALLVGVALASTGCQLERFFPEQVGPGVARLTVRNVATLVGLINDDTRCGFASDAAKAASIVDGRVGDVGTITTTITECELDFGTLDVVSENCNEEQTLTGGKVVVTAVRTVLGQITGDATTPIIPSSSEAVSIEIRAVFADFEVRVSNRDTGLKMKSGTVSYVARPHLYVSSSTGACSVSGSNLSLDDITWEDGLVEMDSGDSVFEVEVPSGTFSAQVGAFGDRENFIEGHVTVWESEIAVPLPDDDEGLDPDYVAEEFAESFACKPDLALPLSTECIDLTPRLVDGSARLVVSSFGNLARLFDNDTRCGFSSPGVLSSVSVQGELGYAGAQARFEQTAECVFEFTEKTAIAEDCNGKITYGQGRVAITGSKIVQGIASGDPAQPIVPTSAHPGFASLSMVLADFTISDSVSTNALTIESGTLTGTSRPKTAKDALTGACSIVTPVARLESVTLSDASVLLNSGGRSFRMDPYASVLTGQNGVDHGVENHLTGSVTYDGTDYSVPFEGGPVLDPTYDASVFDASYACLPGMTVVDGDEDCTFLPVLAEGVARLLVQTVGVAASKVNKDDDCGFENTFVLIDPWLVEGEVGEMGEMTWKIEQCAVGSESLTVHEETCTGGRTLTEGFMVLDATRVVTGERETQVLVIDSIIPRDREAVLVEITAGALDGVTVMPFAPGSAEPKGVLTFDSAAFTARVTPILGERESDPGRFDVPTPVANVHEILVPGATVTLLSAGKTFKLTLDDIVLHATNGSWNGATNRLAGALTVNGARIELGELALDPTYEQTAFDASYACTEDLLEVVPSGP